MKFIKSVPLALSGLSLSIAALGNLLQQYGQWMRYLCGILSAGILIVFALKLILDFPHAHEELKTPVVLSVAPTSTMALMLLCVYIKPYIDVFAICLWYAALVMHLLLMTLFFKRFILGFKLGTVFPSWFVVFVGIVTVAVTAPAMGAPPFGQIVFYAGFALYFAALVLIIIRMIKVKAFPEPARPTIAIFTAPISLCIVGYFSSFEQKNELLVYAMLTLVLASYIYVSIMMVSLFKIKFYPTYAAFTFPYVMSAAAFRLGANFLAEHGLHFMHPAATVSMWIAVAVVLYVLIRYIIFFRWWLRF